MDIQDIARALKTVPDARLRLVELAWECVDPDGCLDMEMAARRMKEIEDAADEAHAYTSATERVRWALTGRR